MVNAIATSALTIAANAIETNMIADDAVAFEK